MTTEVITEVIIEVTIEVTIEETLEKTIEEEERDTLLSITEADQDRLQEPATQTTAPDSTTAAARINTMAAADDMKLKEELVLQMTFQTKAMLIQTGNTKEEESHLPEAWAAEATTVAHLPWTGTETMVIDDLQCEEVTVVSTPFGTISNR